MPPFPASAAGPDLRQLVLGSEGRLGILTQVVLRATPVPEVDRLDAWAVRDWASAQEAVRILARSRLGLSTLRLSTPAETRTLLAFAGRSARARRRAGLAARPARRGRLVAAPRRDVRLQAGRQRRAGGGGIDRQAARWGAGPRGREGVARDRFRSPYLRNALWEAGYGADTLETATDWSRVPALLAGLEPRSPAPWPTVASAST